MKKLSTNEKEELQARISAFSFSGCDAHFSRDMTRYYKSFVGQDFKLLAQLAVHLSSSYMDDGEKEVWFKLSKVSAGNTCNSYMFMHYMCQQVYIVSHLTQRWLVHMSQIVAPVLLLF